MTTHEKIAALVAEVRTMRPEDTDPSTRNVIELFQIAEGLSGRDLLGMILPDPAEADQQVDSLITLLLHVRGDDLAPYDYDRHVLEATATDTDSERNT